MCQNTLGKPPTQVVGAAEIMELERTGSVKSCKVWNVRCSGEVCGAQTLRCTCGSNADSSRHTGPVTRSNWILFSLPTSQDLVICSQRCCECLIRARHCTSWALTSLYFWTTFVKLGKKSYYSTEPIYSLHKNQSSLGNCSKNWDGKKCGLVQPLLPPCFGLKMHLLWPKLIYARSHVNINLSSSVMYTGPILPRPVKLTNPADFHLRPAPPRLALSDTLVFLLNEYFIELNTANFNILNTLLILSKLLQTNKLLNWIVSTI